MGVLFLRLFLLFSLVCAWETLLSDYTSSVPSSTASAQQHGFPRLKKEVWTADLVVLNMDEHPAMDGSADNCLLELVSWLT